MKSVAIYGGGISGLTCAHELIKKGFKVTLYEKDGNYGGMAKSLRTQNNISSEHSWRGYAPFYYNLYNTLKQIPINNSCNYEYFTNHNENIYTVSEIKKHNSKNDLWTYYKNGVYDVTDFVKNHPGGSIIKNCGGKNLEEVWEQFGVSWHNDNDYVLKMLEKYKIGTLLENFTNENSLSTAYDNLSKYKLKFNLLYNNHSKLEQKIKPRDMFFIVYLFLKVILSNKRKKKYFNKQFINLIKNKVHKQTYHYLADFLAGPGFGLDKNTMSLGHYAHFIELNYYTKFNLWSVMNKPTNDAWIDPYVVYLKSLGVKFHNNSNLDKIIVNNKNITHTIVNEKEIFSDIHIIALNPFGFEDVLNKSKLNRFFPEYDNLNTINNQISFRIGFRKYINILNKNKENSFVLIDSPYNITFYPQEEFWCNTSLGKFDNDAPIKSLWSGTCVLPYNKGLLYGKSASQLNIDQLKQEIISQFLASKELLKLIKDNNNIDFDENTIDYIEIYDDWYFSDNRLKTKNKKWVNNFFNEDYRPENYTHFDNLYIAGSHTKTSVNIWSMEGADESGKNCVNLILNKYKKKLVKVYNHESKNIVKFFETIDDILYILKLPHLLDTTIILIVVIIIYKIITNII